MDGYKMKRFEDYGIKTKLTTGTEKTLCPKCSHTRKKANDPCLLVNHDKGSFKCFHCGDWGYLNNNKEQHKPIKAPEYNPEKKGFYKWFFDRSISKETLEKCQVELIDRKIAFQYFKGIDLVNIKYRTHDKKFSQTKDGHSCLYNLNTIKASDYIVITEGEIDALSYEEIGIRAVSVPAGGGKKNLDFIDNSIEYLKNVTKYYLSLDNDKQGFEMREELVRRLGKGRCYLIDLKEYKDANEFLIHEGRDALKEQFEKAELYPNENIRYISQFKDSFYNYLMNGVKQNPVSKIVDSHVVNLESQLVIVSGVPSHGKTTFTLNYLTRIAVYSGWKSAIYSPEHSEVELMKKISYIYTGRSKESKNYPFEVEHFESSLDFMDANFVFVNSEDLEFGYKDVIESIRYLVYSKGIKSVLIDSYMKLETKIENNSETLTIMKILNNLSKICKDLGITIFLIAHPRKMEKKGENFIVPSPYDISGSKSFYDIADVVMTVYRRFDEYGSSPEIHFQKFRSSGEKGEIGVVKDLKFNEINYRFEKQLTYDYLR